MKKKKNIIGILGKRSDDDILHDVLDERLYLEKLKKLVAKRKSIIRPEIAKELQRIDAFLKKKFDAIPSSDFAVDWYYRRLKISDKGIERRIITDSELFECSRQYVEYLEGLYMGEEKLKEVEETNTFKISEAFTEAKIEHLFKQLIKNGYIDNKADIKTFKRIFSIGSERSKKVAWKHTTKNKAQTNKKSLIRLFLLLQEYDYIIIGQPFGINQFKILSDFFTDINGSLMKFNHSNKPDKVGDETSIKGIATINEIVNSLL